MYTSEWAGSKYAGITNTITGLKKGPTKPIQNIDKIDILKVRGR
jgi:hypothetical protein